MYPLRSIDETTRSILLFLEKSYFPFMLSHLHEIVINDCEGWKTSSYLHCWRHTQSCMLGNQICRRSHKQPWCKKCEIATVTAAVNIMIYYQQRANTSLKPAWEFFFFFFFLTHIVMLNESQMSVSISEFQIQERRLRNRTIGAQSFKAHT